MPQVEVEGTFLPDEQDGDHDSGNGLADDGRQRHTGHAHLEEDDEHEVQHHIDDAGHGQTVERAAGVAHSTQQRRAEVVQHGHGHPDEVDLQVEGRKANDIFRAGHQFQQTARRKEAYKGQQHAADETQRHRRLDRILDAAFIFGTKAAGGHDIGTQRKADEEVDQQVDERTVGADSGQCRAAHKPPDHNDVGRVKEELQDAGRCQRQGKQDDLFQHRAGGQVARAGRLCHGKCRLL